MDRSDWPDLLLTVPEPVSRLRVWAHAALWVIVTLWGLRLMSLDLRHGGMGDSFLHGPLLVFHEAGHVLLRPLGEWLTVFGGTLMQLLLPAVMCGALLLKTRDPFGAAVALWLFGVSVIDVAPYVYDARLPQLMLLTGGTGEEGGHDWIYLLDSVGLRARSQGLGQLVRLIGASIVLASLAWAGLVLRREHLAARAVD